MTGGQGSFTLSAESDSRPQHVPDKLHPARDTWATASALWWLTANDDEITAHNHVLALARQSASAGNTVWRKL